MTEQASDDAEKTKLEEHWKAIAVETIAGASELLLRAGWDFVAISISRAVPVGGGVIGPGASILRFDDCMNPALPSEARNLRHLATMADAAFAEAVSKEAATSHIEEVIWPGMKR